MFSAKTATCLSSKYAREAADSSPRTASDLYDRIFILLLVAWMIFTSFHYIHLIKEMDTAAAGVTSRGNGLKRIADSLQPDREISDKTTAKNISNSNPLASLSRFTRSPVLEKALVGSHVEGATDSADPDASQVQNPKQGEVFKWSTGDDSFHMNVDISAANNGTYLNILVPGYYYVYSQITFNTDGRSNVCYDTVKLERGDDTTTALLTSCAIQITKNTKNGPWNAFNYQDSAYHGGVFWMGIGDKLAIKPRFVYPNTNERTFRFDSSKAFFGAFRLFR